MEKSIPKFSRYRRTLKFVRKYIEYEQIKSYPFNPIQFIIRHGWGLVKYSDLAESLKVTVDRVVLCLGSKDAVVLYDPDFDNYTIAYNDDVENSARLKFTIMHEIGHIALRHCLDFEETKLNRGGLSESKYKVLENEASAFARNVLCPCCIVKELNLGIAFEISEVFRLSLLASKSRLALLQEDLANTEKADSSFLKNNFLPYIVGIKKRKKCELCGAMFCLSNVNYCPVCGSDESIYNYLDRWGFEMIYPGIEVDQNGRALICPVCKNEEVTYGPKCIICATPLVNYCTNDGNGYDSCGINLPGNARYCHQCGAKSSFFVAELLKDWETVQGMR